jgi:hypothetical protein
MSYQGLCSHYKLGKLGTQILEKNQTKNWVKVWRTSAQEVRRIHAKNNKDRIYLISDLVSSQHRLCRKLFFLFRLMELREISVSDAEVTRVYVIN